MRIMPILSLLYLLSFMVSLYPEVATAGARTDVRLRQDRGNIGESAVIRSGTGS